MYRLFVCPFTRHKIRIAMTVRPCILLVCSIIKALVKFSVCQHVPHDSANIARLNCRGARRTRTLRSGRFRLYGSVPVPFRNFFNPLDGRWTGRSTPVMTVKSTAVTAVKTVGRVSTISESSQAPKVLKCNHHYFISPSCHPIYTSLRATGDSCRSQKKPSPLMRSMVESAAPSSLLGPPHPYVGTQPPPSQRPSLLCNCFRRA